MSIGDVKINGSPKYPKSVNKKDVNGNEIMKNGHFGEFFAENFTTYSMSYMKFIEKSFKFKIIKTKLRILIKKFLLKSSVQP